MGKVKIYEIAKSLELTSKEVLDIAAKLNIEAKSHLSGIDEQDAKKIKNNLVEKTAKKKDNKEEKKATKKEAKKEEKQPVIIRREVIIANEPIKKEEENKEKQSKRNNIGFVERKDNKDYNIVYRNKTNKPMSVNELFGLKQETKSEEKIKEEIKTEEIKVEEKVEKKEEKEISTQTQVVEKVEKVETKSQTTKPENNNNNNNRTYQNRNNNTNNRPGYNNNQTGNRNNNNNDRPAYNNNNNQNGGYNNNRPAYNNNNNQNGGYNNNRPAYNNNNNQNGGYNNNRPAYNNNNNQSGGYNNNRPAYNNNNNQSGGYNNNRPGYNNNNNQSGGYNNNRPGYNNNNNQSGGYNNNRPGNNRFGPKRPLDEKGIDRNIKDIMSAETLEKDSVKEYNRSVDKQKASKFEDNKTKKSKTKKGNGEGEFDEQKLKGLKQTNQLSNMFNDQEGGMLDYYDLTTARGRRGRRKNNRNIQNKIKQKIFKLTEITIPETITVKDLAAELKKTTADVIKKLLGFGIMATINNDIDFDTAFLIAQEFGVTAIKKEIVKEEDVLFDETDDKEEDLVTRPPVVVVMGHVDHGKTSLLDAVKKTNVIGGEAGGITQHIGAYKVKIGDKEITFLDTPGHEAFTSMRARGAQITDIAILVVAANDGVMPQTIEAINHAKSAKTPIIVAINKIDLPDANIEKVKQELMAHELVAEEWGGDTIFVPISAKNNQNIDQLLEMVLLQAEVLELKTNPKKQAKGVVIEARLDTAKGPVATLLVQRGTLDEGDTIVVGSSIGRIRAMKNDKAKKVKSAGPSTPVSIIGLTEVPEGGDTFYEVKDEKMAKHLIDRRKRQAREELINEQSKITLDNLFSKMEEGKLKVLNLIVKADVQGSVEVVKQSVEKLTNEEVRVKVIHAATGAVTESDERLAKVSNAIIIAFNVRPVPIARDMAKKDGIEIKQYSIIYQAIEDIEAAMKGMLDPKFEEKVIGNAEIREVFKISNVGTIAGVYVLSGKVERNAGVRIIRDNVVIHDGKLCTLKRFKDDAKEVSKGFECGIQIENYNDIEDGDIIEAYIMEEIKR